MSVYLPRDCKTWRYRFTWRGVKHTGSTGQVLKDDAKLVDAAEQLRVRRAAHNIAPFDPARSPLISDWAEVYYKDVVTRRRERIKRPERIDNLIRMALRFWGRPPALPKPLDAGEPFHGLRLIDPIIEPQWVQRFEMWMDGKGWAGQTKNQYRSLMSQMYKLAQSHTWAKVTQIDQNPFTGLERDPKISRTVTSSLEDLRAVLAAAPFHLRLAISIGLLAHKLRLQNILNLTWKDHIIDLGPRVMPGGQMVYGWIQVIDHKTSRRTGRPLVVPIVKQLHDILVEAKARQVKSTCGHVVQYRDKAIGDLHTGLRLVCERAGVPYGRYKPNGVTFHTLRHTSSTTMAELDISEAKRKSAAGHESIQTTQGYTHLKPIHELAPLEQLSAALPIADVVTARVRYRPADRLPDHLTLVTPAKDARTEVGTPDAMDAGIVPSTNKIGA